MDCCFPALFFFFYLHNTHHPALTLPQVYTQFLCTHSEVHAKQCLIKHNKTRFNRVLISLWKCQQQPAPCGGLDCGDVRAGMQRRICELFASQRHQSTSPPPLVMIIKQHRTSATKGKARIKSLSPNLQNVFFLFAYSLICVFTRTTFRTETDILLGRTPGLIFVHMKFTCLTHWTVRENSLFTQLQWNYPQVTYIFSSITV